MPNRPRKLLPALGVLFLVIFLNHFRPKSNLLAELLPIIIVIVYYLVVNPAFLFQQLLDKMGICILQPDFKEALLLSYKPTT